MLTFGIFLGALLFIIGLLTYWLAPRVGPNPIFGVRIGYAFASREVWDRTNRAGGALIAATGAGVILLAFVLRMLSIADNSAIAINLGAMLVALIAETVWLGFYARRLAQRTVLAQEITPVQFRWAYLAPVLVSSAALIAAGVYFYPFLPPDRVATHFDFNGQPNDWMSRGSLYLFFIGLGLFLVLINALVVLVATHEPLIAFKRWGARWRMGPEHGLVYTGLALGLGDLILAYAFLDIGWFNTRGSHVVPITAFLWIVFLLIPILIALFFVLGQRERDPAKNR